MAAVEIAFALHGWSAVPRYLFEPEAVLIMLAGSRRSAGPGVRAADVARAASAGPRSAAILIALIPPASTERNAQRPDRQAARSAAPAHRLQEVIERLGGPERIRACGQPVTLVGWQSTVAWQTDLNVGNVGYKPGREIDRGDPIVVLKPHLGGWQVRPIHTLPRQARRLRGLRTDTGFRPS